MAKDRTENNKMSDTRTWQIPPSNIRQCQEEKEAYKNNVNAFFFNL